MTILNITQKIRANSSSIFAAGARGSGVGEANGWYNEHCKHGAVFAVDVSQIVQ